MLLQSRCSPLLGVLQSRDRDTVGVSFASTPDYLPPLGGLDRTNGDSGTPTCVPSVVLLWLQFVLPGRHKLLVLDPRTLLHLQTLHLGGLVPPCCLPFLHCNLAIVTNDRPY
jgi:hypothetical protein